MREERAQVSIKAAPCLHFTAPCAARDQCSACTGHPASHSTSRPSQQEPVSTPPACVPAARLQPIPTCQAPPGEPLERAAGAAAACWYSRRTRRSPSVGCPAAPAAPPLPQCSQQASQQSQRPCLRWCSSRWPWRARCAAAAVARGRRAQLQAGGTGRRLAADSDCPARLPNRRLCRDAWARCSGWRRRLRA